jgi:Holliday junction resolvase RusA-like endonuclease
MVEFVLPYPRSINRERVRAIRAARRFAPLVEPLAVEFEIQSPDNRRAIDNVQKALLDTMQHGGD